MNTGSLIKRTVADLKAAGVGSPRLDTLLLLEAATGLDRSFLSSHEDYEPGTKQLLTFKSLVKRRLKREPIAYILGKKEFYGYEFGTEKGVLIPRVETENIVEHIIDSTGNGAMVLDMGTGSGAIAISLKKQRPDLQVTAVDISTPALKLAAYNAERLNADIRLVKSDLFENVHGSFDVVAANLPYVAEGADVTEEVKQEPAEALFSGSDGLDIYRRFMKHAGKHLKTGSELVIECEKHQAGALASGARTLKSLSNFVHVIKLP